MRRGQAEIIGLVLIVILLAVGFLLYIKFSVNKDTTSVTAGYEETRLGSSFVTSLAKSTVLCGALQPSVEELVKQIATGSAQCRDAEALLQQHIQNILTPSMKKWGKNYWLRIVRKTSAGYEGIGVIDFKNPDISENQRCNDNMNRVADTYPLAGVSPTVEIVLYQCSD